MSARMIKLRVRNYKILQDATLDIEPHVTVIVGRNDTGKSLLLEALWAYHRIQWSAEDLFGFYQALGEGASLERSPVFEATWEVDGQLWTHQIHAHPRHPEERLVSAEREWLWMPKEGALITHSVHDPQPIDRYETRLEDHAYWLSNIGTLAWESGSQVPIDVYTPTLVTQQFITPLPRLLEVSWLQMPGREGESPLANRYGAGWVDLLQGAINRRDGSIEEIEAQMQEMFPFFLRCRIVEEKIPMGESISPRVIRGSATYHRRLQVQVRGPQGDTPWLEAPQLSAGVVLALAMLSLIFATPERRMIAFEEPENGLNPAILTILIKTILRLTSQRQQQVLLTTHHAWWLDEVPPDSIRVMVRDEAGAHVRALDAASWREGLDSGDVFLSEVFNIFGPEGLLRKKHAAPSDAPHPETSP
jgi:hypothetical protein